MITCKVISGFCPFWLSIVYGLNYRAGRQELWEDLSLLSDGSSSPWLLMGDFGDYCQKLQNNKQSNDDRTWCKLDRVMGNSAWFQAVFDVQVDFLELGISDHSPALVCFSRANVAKGRQFKYLNGWAQHQDFQQTVQDHWHQQFRGTKMFCFFEKLKVIKRVLRELHRSSYSHISKRVDEARDALFLAQQKLQNQPRNNDLMVQESSLMRHFLLLQKAELSFAQ
ncbi:hypothetical protein RND81_09G070200 [Saponaria officinalis]|uniref:Endonuclease/exonuclease/phosphatase domain-containing protein n=1 Tax=Saponaria officinalis TaxID=3572 RepID=A0AAW1IJP6_SAPOF